MPTEEQMKEMRESQAEIFKMVTYRNTKNYIHNDLGVTREWIEGVIRDEVRAQVQKRLDGGNHWLSTRLEEAVYKWRGSEVIREVAREIAGRIQLVVKE